MEKENQQEVQSWGRETLQPEHIKLIIRKKNDKNTGLVSFTVTILETHIKIKVCESEPSKNKIFP